MMDAEPAKAFAGGISTQSSSGFLLATVRMRAGNAIVLEHVVPTADVITNPNPTDHNE